MDNRQAIKIIKTEKSWESDERINNAFDLGIQALEKQEKITKLLKCHDDFNVNTTQVNYELLKAIRVILEIDEKVN